MIRLTFLSAENHYNGTKILLLKSVTEQIDIVLKFVNGNLTIIKNDTSISEQTLLDPVKLHDQGPTSPAPVKPAPDRRLLLLA